MTAAALTRPTWTGSAAGLVCWACRNVPRSSARPCKSNPRPAKARPSLSEHLPLRYRRSHRRLTASAWHASMPDPSGRLRVLLADDHVVVRQGLKLVIEGQKDMIVVSEAGDGATAIQHAQELRPDVVIMDISMPGMNGLVATRTLKRVLPQCVVVTLTRHADDAYLQELMRAGASAYILKQSAPAELITAIRTCAAGGQYLDSALTARVTAGFLGRDGRKVTQSGGTPSDRESEVLRLIAAGYSNKEIATRLTLSVKTVEAHKANAMRKLGLNGRIDIVKYAI